MPQDRESGARAAAWGHEAAYKIAWKIGATGMGKTSNECQLNGEHVVIKCARRNTTSVGVTYQMLTRIDRVIGAFELDDGLFELWAISPKQFESSMRESITSGGKTALVSRSFFEQHGKKIQRVQLAGV
jgi:hypothetical protein